MGAPERVTEETTGGAENAGEAQGVPRRADRAARRGGGRCGGGRCGGGRCGGGRWGARGRFAGRSGEAGMATAEYAIATLAAAGFAGLLVAVLRSDEVRGLLSAMIRQALSV